MPADQSVRLSPNAVAALDQILDSLVSDDAVEGYQFGDIVVTARAFKVAVGALRAHLHEFAEEELVL